MEDFNAPKVSVTMRITEEAAEVLQLYATSRNKGRLVSQLVVEYGKRRVEMAAEKAVEAKKAAADRAVEAAARAREKYSIPVPGNKKGKRR